MKTENLIVTMTFDYALDIIALYRNLISEKEFVISRQLLRSATSIGANVEEATAAQTKKDFIAKMSIASKEARETKYWIRLLHKSKLVEIEFADMLDKIDHIINVISKIILTSKANLKAK
jgi:four helix bundle protein